MKYLCVNPHGDLEIWEEDFRPYWFVQISEVDFRSIDAGLVADPEHVGREVLEVWEE
jgi:hypothetical protein